MYVPSLLHRVIGAVEELKVAIDGEEEYVTCAVSFIRGRGAVCVEIQEAAVETYRKKAEQ